MSQVPPPPLPNTPGLKPHRGVAVLTLGILSIAVTCVGLITGILAWSMGSADLREMDAGLMDPAGRGLTTAGRICGIVGTCFQAGMVCFGVIWMLFVVLMGGLFSHFQPQPH